MNHQRRSGRSASPEAGARQPSHRGPGRGNAFAAERLQAGQQREQGPVRREARNTIQETISDAPSAFSAWAGRFTWQSKFALEIDLDAPRLGVVVRLYCPGADASVKSAWEQAIEQRWSGKRTLHLAGETAEDPGKDLPIAVDVQWVERRRDAHYTITANRPGANEGGRAGLGGTTSMTGWGVSDTDDVTHEFGHMLGAPEDYFTTNGEDHTHGGTRRGFRDEGGGIMNNPSEDPLAEHYDLVRREAARALRIPETRATVR